MISIILGAITLAFAVYHRVTMNKLKRGMDLHTKALRRLINGN